MVTDIFHDFVFFHNFLTNIIYIAEKKIIWCVSMYYNKYKQNLFKRLVAENLQTNKFVIVIYIEIKTEKGDNSDTYNWQVRNW